ncbi:MAG: gluconokinase [Chitinophagaceae bacterium]
MNYYIGIDIGTTSTKAVAFSDSGDVIARETIAYAIIHPQANFSEQRPDEILEAVLNSIGKITGTLHADKPVFISFSAAMHSLLVVDTSGHPLTNCIIWADNRAGEIGDELRDSSQGMAFYHDTGVPVHAMSPFCKLIWYKEHMPALFKRAYKFIGIKEYIFFRLFGQYLVDTGIASATGLMNIYTLQWDENILAYTGIKKDQLSEVVAATHRAYLPKASIYFSDKRLAHVVQSAFVIGGSDGGLANLGSGAITKNSVAISIGTSSAVRMVTSEVYTDAHMRTFCYHMRNQLYIIGGASNNGAVVLQWLKDNLLQTADTYEQLFEQAATVAPACNGLFFIPYILGERAPVWNANAKGVFFGLDITHTKAHMIRAVMEGVIYSVYSIGKVLMEKRTVTEIHATGGFTQSPFWLQMLCDMFNCTVLVSGAVETSAFGAVKIGMDAIGSSNHWTPRTTETYEPDALQHKIYLRQFQKMERIYEALKKEMINTEPNTVSTLSIL